MPTITEEANESMKASFKTASFNNSLKNNTASWLQDFNTNVPDQVGYIESQYQQIKKPKVDIEPIPNPLCNQDVLYDVPMINDKNQARKQVSWGRSNGYDIIKNKIKPIEL
jgi:hypothetical protein